MSDTQFSDLPAGAQVVSAPQQQAAQPQGQSQSFSDLPQGAQVISTPQANQTTTQPQTQSKTENKPDFGDMSGSYGNEGIDPSKMPSSVSNTISQGASRAYTTGPLGGAVPVVENTAKDRAEKLVQMYDMLRKGDRQGALHSAISMIPFVDPKGPEMKVLQKIIHAPFDEANEAFKASMATTGNPTENIVQSLAHGVSAVVPPLSAPIQQGIEDVKNKNFSGLAGDAIGALENAAMFMWGDNPVKEEAASTAASTAAKAGVEEAPKPTPDTISTTSQPDIVSKTVRPGTVNIAGVDVPVSTTQAAKQGRISKFLQKSASAEGAQKFIDERVQPAVEEANRANFADTAKSEIEHIQSLRGEQPSAPNMTTFQDMSDNMQKEAQVTYKKLDEAALNSPELLQLQNDVAKAQSAYTEAQAAVKEKSNVDLGAQGPKEAKGAQNARKLALQTAKTDAQQSLADVKGKLNDWMEDNTFTKLQQKISDAKRTMTNDAAGADDKAIAKRTIEETKLKLEDFIDNHGHNLESGELESANSLWSKSKQFEFLRDKMRSATRGTEGTASPLKPVKTSISAKQLEAIPSAFDKEFGEGAFHDLLGDKGLTNYNNQINALKNPIKGGTDYADFMLGTGKIYAKLGILSKAAHWIPDQILFNPELGQSVLDKFSKVKNMVVPKATPKPTTTSSLRNVYNGLQNNLAG